MPLVALFLMAMLLHSHAASAPCDIEAMHARVVRAWEAREDHFLWEDIDPREASADLDRFIARLERLLEIARLCGALEIEQRANRALASARRQARNASDAHASASASGGNASPINPPVR